jgi:hypothetical protein
MTASHPNLRALRDLAVLALAATAAASIWAQGLPDATAGYTEAAALPRDGWYCSAPDGTRVLKPQPGQRYALVLGQVPFSFAVTHDPHGLRYDIQYGDHDYRYVLGRPGALTLVHSMADLDEDGLPDFQLQVGDDSFLLLSTEAQPGDNPPTAQYPAANHSAGC